jgi:hypothetical protein
MRAQLCEAKALKQAVSLGNLRAHRHRTHVVVTATKLNSSKPDEQMWNGKPSEVLADLLSVERIS